MSVAATWCRPSSITIAPGGYADFAVAVHAAVDAQAGEDYGFVTLTSGSVTRRVPYAFSVTRPGLQSVTPVTLKSFQVGNTLHGQSHAGVYRYPAAPFGPAPNYTGSPMDESGAEKVYVTHVNEAVANIGPGDDDATTGYTVGGGHQVEDLRVDGSTLRGVWIQGRGNRVHGTLITRSGGSTFFTDVSVASLDVRGPGARVLDNTVVETHGVGSGTGWGLWILGGDAVAEGNRISNAHAEPGVDAIVVTAGSRAVLSRNRLLNVARGIVFEPGAGGLVRGTSTFGCSIPFVLGAAIDAGGNQ